MRNYHLLEQILLLTFDKHLSQHDIYDDYLKNHAEKYVKTWGEDVVRGKEIPMYAHCKAIMAQFMTEMDILDTDFIETYEELPSLYRDMLSGIDIPEEIDKMLKYYDYNITNYNITQNILDIKDYLADIHTDIEYEKNGEAGF